MTQFDRTIDAIMLFGAIPALIGFAAVLVYARPLAETCAALEPSVRRVVRSAWHWFVADVDGV